MKTRIHVIASLSALLLAALACGPLGDITELQSTVEAGSGTLAAEATRLGPTLEAEATRLGPTVQAQATNAAATIEAGGFQETAEAAVPGLQETLEAIAPGLEATVQALEGVVEVEGSTVLQWAIAANATSEYSEQYGAETATGQPDIPEGACSDTPGAWASAESTGVDTLTLDYAVPVIPTQINIVETYNPGQITTVTVVTITGEESVVYEAEPAIVDDCPRTLTVDVTGVSTPVNQMLITVDQTGGNWNEIDAVQLIGTVQP